MEETDEIIVLKRFETSIEANLAKTKLDAYGIPCFLTEENVTNLYPLTDTILFGVRLHIFKKDETEAHGVLHELYQHEEEITNCPRCRSANVKIETTEKFDSRMWRLVAALLIFIPLPKVYRCQDCYHEFKL